MSTPGYTLHANASGAPQAGPLARLARKRLLAVLSDLPQARISLREGAQQSLLGSGNADDAATLQADIEVVDAGFYLRLAAGGSIGAGEAYMDGLWRSSDLVTLLRAVARNRQRMDAMDSGGARLLGLLLRAWQATRRNTVAGSRRNIAAHYDLGNDFFELFLSDDLMYSSGYWVGPHDTLEAASTRKLDLICRKLELKRGDRVVEIGTGWGGFALHAARHYGCHVTTTTISRQQHALACERVAAAGLGDLVHVLLEDYRDLDGRYDKLVSIEMIEAIGAEYLDTYFRQLGRLLKPDGLALLQAITIEDHRYAQALKSVDFIKRHVFPGCFIPSLNAMLAAKTRSCDLTLIAQEDFGRSYALTLEAWRRRFLAKVSAVRARGFDERFIRMWEFYLAYCEGGFRERSIGVSHLLLAGPGWRPGAAASA